MAALLVSDDLVDSSTFTRSIKNAWLAFAFLNSSLEEIREEQRNKDEICLRLPIRNGRVRQTALSFKSQNLTSIDDGTHSFFNLEDMFRWYTSVSSSPVLKHEQKTSLTASSFPYLRQEIARSAFRALSFSRNHDEIIACGYIARSFSSLDNNRNFSPVMLWDVAITNYLYEAATYPAGWTMFLDLLLSRTNSFGEIASNLTDQNNEPNLCSRLRHDIKISPPISDQWLTMLLQFDELLTRWLSSSITIPSEIANS
ncbi:MAG: hypothetical protein IPP22_09265 [Nitrosomonas sp.]|nr:hypothetical protein [Nitrosomonas sp.]